MRTSPSPPFQLMSYFQSLLIVGAVSLLNIVLVPLIGYHAAGFVYLLTVMLLGLFFTVGPILFAAVLTALSWDFLFIPPTPDFRMSSPGDLCMMIAYFCAAIITGTLTQQIRNHESQLKSRQSRLSSLYEVVREIASATSFKSMIEAVTEQVSLFFDGQCAVILFHENVFLPETSPGLALVRVDPTEIEVAIEKVRNFRRPVGWGTSLCPEAKAVYVPLLGDSDFLGVVVFHPGSRDCLIDEDRTLLLAITRQLAIALEREIFQGRAAAVKQLAESEKLHQTILDSISHEIRTPLTALIGLASTLAEPKNYQSDRCILLAENLVDAGERLNHVVENLLDMSRLTSGGLTLKRDWHDLSDLVSVSIAQHQKNLAQHKLTFQVQERMPLVRLDFKLFEQVLGNLLRNAATYSPTETEIVIDIGHQEDKPFVKVRDQGPGIPSDAAPFIFEKFYRVPGTKPGGTGLGLTIAKGIVEAHGAELSFSRPSVGGVEFKILFPHETQPSTPEVEH